ncbi:MAG: nucleoside triphosphate pyrophosphohydrolase [Bdellovibrionales bacterium]
MSATLERLLSVMTRLRDPHKGCPWDLEQDFKSLTSCTLEEAYETVEAIESGDPAAMKDELGDLLFQIVFYAQLAREQGLFDFEAIANHVADKMIERHPHVFGDREAKTAHAVVVNWEADKAAKRERLAKDKGHNHSVLDGVSPALPGSTRAVKLQKRASRIGFDWNDPLKVLDKLDEEVEELKAEMRKAPCPDPAALADELGDVYFVLANLARHLELDPETCMRHANAKFERRFRYLESRMQEQGLLKSGEKAPLDAMESLWNEAKTKEKDKS